MSPRRCARPLSNCKGSGKNSRSSLVLAHGGGIKFASTSTRAEAFSISRDDCVGRNGCIEFPATAWPGRRQSVDRGRCDRSEYAGRRTRARRREHSSHDSLRRLQAPFCGWPHYRRFVPRYILLSHGSRRNEEMGRHTAPHQISCNLLRVLPIWLLSEHPAGVRRSARHGIHALACVGDAEQLRVGLGRERLPGRKRTEAESWQPATIRGTKTKKPPHRGSDEAACLYRRSREGSLLVTRFPCRTNLRGSWARRGHILPHLFRLFQVALQGGKRLRREISKGRFLSAAGFLIEISDIFFVVFHHVARIGAVKRRSGQLGKRVIGRLVFRAHIVRKRDVFLGRSLLQFVARFSVILNHALAKFFYRIAGALIPCELPHFNFRHAALRGFLCKLCITRRYPRGLRRGFLMREHRPAPQEGAKSGDPGYVRCFHQRTIQIPHACLQRNSSPSHRACGNNKSEHGTSAIRCWL